MKKAVLKKIFEIEKELAGYDSDEISLYGGATGIALFYAELFELTNEEIYAEKAADLVDKVITKMSEIPMHHTLAGGFTGVAWGTNHLIKKGLLEADADELFKDLDPYIQMAGIRDLRMGNYDFLHAGTGPIFFSLERLHDKNVITFLNQAVTTLDQVKLQDTFGIKWIDNFSRLTKPDIIFNFGLAHGLPSVVLVLLKVFAQNILQDETSRLVRGTLDYIYHHKNETGARDSLYPSYIAEDGNKHSLNSRLAWCYGDLTIALMFWHAGKILHEPRWEQEGLAIMKHCLKRTDPLHNNHLDAGLCHGTAGIAHIFKKFYNITGDKEFLDRASFWMNETLKLAKFENGLAGYKSYNTLTKEPWVNEYGLLEGIAGIGLAMISYLSDETPSWDECLLLS